MDFINLCNVTKQYRRNKSNVTALKNVSFTITKGDMIAITGESGSGKTTLLSIMGGLLPCTEGEYFYQGQPIHNKNQKQLADFRRENIGFIIQDYALIHSRTVYENLELPLKGRYPKSIRNEMILESLTDVHMSDKIRCYPNQLSGGEKQRVAIARAVVHHPKVIIADEPTGALDKETIKTILSLLHKINDVGITVILATHNESVVNDCEKCYHLEDGVIYKQ